MRLRRRRPDEPLFRPVTRARRFKTKVIHTLRFPKSGCLKVVVFIVPTPPQPRHDIIEVPILMATRISKHIVLLYYKRFVCFFNFIYLVKRNREYENVFYTFVLYYKLCMDYFSFIYLITRVVRKNSKNNSLVSKKVYNFILQNLQSIIPTGLCKII